MLLLQVSVHLHTSYLFVLESFPTVLADWTCLAVRVRATLLLFSHVLTIVSFAGFLLLPFHGHSPQYLAEGHTSTLLMKVWAQIDHLLPLVVVLAGRS